jgi:hypothetical protein
LTLDIRIEWGTDDRYWFAGFMRDGESFVLDGALTGAGATPDRAVKSLLEIADYLVRNGENGMTNGPISVADRTWLFKLLDNPHLVGSNQARYQAMWDLLSHDPYATPDNQAT